MAKTLVAYFSATGATARVAEALAQTIGADTYEIAPEVPYTAADLNWNNQASRSSVEMNDENSRHSIAGAPIDVAPYDTVFVGFPVWWYVEPRIIDTFLESADFSGKTIVPFATSGGSGLGQAPQRMSKLAPGAQVLSGRRLPTNAGTDELAGWARSLDLA